MHLERWTIEDTEDIYVCSVSVYMEEVALPDETLPRQVLTREWEWEEEVDVVETHEVFEQTLREKLQYGLTIEGETYEPFLPQERNVYWVYVEEATQEPDIRRAVCIVDISLVACSLATLLQEELRRFQR